MAAVLANFFLLGWRQHSSKQHSWNQGDWQVGRRGWPKLAAVLTNFFLVGWKPQASVRRLISTRRQALVEIRAPTEVLYEKTGSREDKASVRGLISTRRHVFVEIRHLGLTCLLMVCDCCNQCDWL